MTEPFSGLDRADRNRGFPIVIALILIAAAFAAGWFWRAEGDRAATERIVRDYILAHPEILPQAMDNLARKENAKQLSGVRAEVEKPFAGAVLGNPGGKVTLVEFTDFACGYCRQSVADVDALIGAHPDLRVVVRELPILSPESADAARWALAAAEQGKYAAFHRAMFMAGHPAPETIEAAAKVAGLDLDRARRTIADPRVEAELKRNLAVARQLGFSGTPSWVVGEEILSGAVGRDRLSKAIDQARGG
jgi:protein-disulfide isomerase